MNKLFLILLLFTCSISFGQSNFFWSHNGNNANVKYGCLYNWFITQGIDGNSITSSDIWKVPTDTAFYTLLIYLDPSATQFSNIAGNKMKKTGTVFWNTTNINVTNITNFSGVGNGYRSGTTGAFLNFKNYANYWNKTEAVGMGKVSGLGHDVSYLLTSELASNYVSTGKSFGQAIRLVRNATTHEQTLSDGTYVSYYKGNNNLFYKCIKIGTQIWMAENLAETKYRNGIWIDGYNSGVYTTISNATWLAKTTPAMCVYNDDLSVIFNN